MHDLIEIEKHQELSYINIEKFDRIIKQIKESDKKILYILFKERLDKLTKE